MSRNPVDLSPKQPPFELPPDAGPFLAPQLDGLSARFVVGDPRGVYAFQYESWVGHHWGYRAQRGFSGWSLFDGFLYVMDGPVLSRWDLAGGQPTQAINLLTGSRWDGSGNAPLRKSRGKPIIVALPKGMLDLFAEGGDGSFSGPVLAPSENRRNPYNFAFVLQNDGTLHRLNDTLQSSKRTRLKAPDSADLALASAPGSQTLYYWADAALQVIDATSTPRFVESWKPPGKGPWTRSPALPLRVAGKRVWGAPWGLPGVFGHPLEGEATIKDVAIRGQRPFFEDYQVDATLGLMLLSADTMSTLMSTDTPTPEQRWGVVEHPAGTRWVRADVQDQDVSAPLAIAAHPDPAGVTLGVHVLNSAGPAIERMAYRIPSLLETVALKGRGAPPDTVDGPLYLDQQNGVATLFLLARAADSPPLLLIYDTSQVLVNVVARARQELARIASAPDNTVLCCGRDRRVGLYDASYGLPRLRYTSKQYDANKAPITAVAAAGGSKSLVAAAGGPTVLFTGEVLKHIFNSHADGVGILSFGLPRIGWLQEDGMPWPRFHGKNELLVVGLEQLEASQQPAPATTAAVFNALDGKIISAVSKHRRAGDTKYPVSGAALNRAGDELFVAFDLGAAFGTGPVEVGVFRIPSIPEHVKRSWTIAEPVQALRASPTQDQLLVIGSTTRIVGMKDGEVLQSLGEGIVVGEFSRDGERLLTLSGNGCLQLWEPGSGASPLWSKQLSEPGTDYATLSPDRRLIVTAGGTSALVLDAATGTQRGALSHGGRINSVSVTQGPEWARSYAPSGTRIITGSEDATMAVWDGATSQPLFTVPVRAPVAAVATLVDPALPGDLQ